MQNFFLSPLVYIGFYLYSRHMHSIYDTAALQKFLTERGEKPFRLTQIHQALYKDLIEDISTCTTLAQ